MSACAPAGILAGRALAILLDDWPAESGSPELDRVVLDRIARALQQTWPQWYGRVAERWLPETPPPPRWVAAQWSRTNPPAAAVLRLVAAAVT